MEQSHRIEPSKIITADNVTLSASGNLYTKVVDPVKACYASENPIYAVVTHAESSLRSALGSMELDAILNGRTEINKRVADSIKDAADTWGLEVLRYEVTEISPDRSMTEAMNKQANAERERREQILNAEGSKRSAELISEGNLRKAINEAEAVKQKLILEAQGLLEAEQIKAEAVKRSINIISSVVSDPIIALTYLIAEKQIEMQGRIGSTSNTIFFNKEPADLNALLAQAKAILNTNIKNN